MGFRCFFGMHKWRVVATERGTAIIAGLVTLFKDKEEDCVVSVQRCLLCGRRRGLISTMSGLVKEVNPNLFSFMVNEFCDECDKPGCYRRAPEHWPKDAPGVPADAVYCDSCWEEVDADMREDGFVPIEEV